MDATATKEKKASGKSFILLYDKTLYKYVPYFVLVVLLILFGITTEGSIFSGQNMGSIINQTVITATVSTGATFIFASGAFDVSLGYACAVSAILAAKIYQALGSDSLLLLFALCMVFALFIEAFSSVLAAVFKLPVFILTIAMMSVLQSLQTNLITGSNIKIFSETTQNFEDSPVKYLMFFVYLVICVLIFHKTKVGRSVRLLGGNPISAQQTGINPSKYTIYCFLLAGVGVGIGAFLTCTRTGILSPTTCSSLGMDVMIAIVLGGMPISGGAKSNMIAATVGSFIVVFLNMGLSMMGVSGEWVQVTRGLMFLVLVLAAVKRQRLLPR